MEVIYKKTVFDKLEDAVQEAILADKKIEKFILTTDESKEFAKLAYSLGKIGVIAFSCADGQHYKGIPIEVKPIFDWPVQYCTKEEGGTPTN